MDKHAMVLLDTVEACSWPVAFCDTSPGPGASPQSKGVTVTAKVLSGFITESIKLGGTLLEYFWVVVGKCHPELGRNSTLPSVPPGISMNLLKLTPAGLGDSQKTRRSELALHLAGCICGFAF